jgi:hypothetical protein
MWRSLFTVHGLSDMQEQLASPKTRLLSKHGEL